MKYCSECAAKVQLRVPVGDHLPRYVCEACGTIHYQNPRLVVGCVPDHEGSILLCRRAIEPRRGYWTVPAGFMENRRDAAAGRGARVAGGSPRRGRDRLAARGRARAARRAGARVLPRQPAAGALRARTGEPGGGAGAPTQDIPWEDSPFAAPISRCGATSRTGRGARAAPLHHPRPARPGRDPGVNSPPARRRGTMPPPVRGARRCAPFAEHPSRSANDLCRHRKLHQVQVHGLRGGLPGGLLPRGAELPGHRSRTSASTARCASRSARSRRSSRKRRCRPARSTSSSSTPNWPSSGR